MAPAVTGDYIEQTQPPTECPVCKQQTLHGNSTIQIQESEKKADGTTLILGVRLVSFGFNCTNCGLSLVHVADEPEPEPEP